MRAAACFTGLVFLAARADAGFIIEGSFDALQDALQVPRSGSETPGLKDLKAGVREFEEGRFEACRASLEAAAARNSAFPPARLMLARLFLLAGRPVEGRAELEALAATRPDLPDIYLIFGDLALREGHLNNASLNYERALALMGEPKSVESSDIKKDRSRAWAGLASVAETRQDWRSAEAALRSWLGVEPTSAAAGHRLGVALFHLGEREEAVEAFRTAAERERTLGPVPITMARLCEQVGAAEETERWLSRAASHGASDTKVLTAFVYWELEHRRPERAEAHAEAALGLDPASIDALLAMGLVQRSLRNHPAAERFFEQAAASAPDNFEVRNQLALVLAEQDDEAKRERARDLAETNLRRHPQSSEAFATLSRVRSRTGRRQEALELASRAVSGGRASSDTLYLLAQALVDSERAEEARPLLDRAIEAKGVFFYFHEAQRLRERLAAASRGS